MHRPRFSIRLPRPLAATLAVLIGLWSVLNVVYASATPGRCPMCALVGTTCQSTPDTAKPACCQKPAKGKPGSHPAPQHCCCPASMTVAMTHFALYAPTLPLDTWPTYAVPAMNDRLITIGIAYPPAA
ncbi:MAG: hypothetical protein ABI743_11495 [bacterium]